MPRRAAPLAGLELLGGTRSGGEEIPCGKEEVSRTSSSKKEICCSSFCKWMGGELGCSWRVPQPVLSALRNRVVKVILLLCYCWLSCNPGKSWG